MRECVAIVMMPSFVPYVTCDVASSWFRVNDPKCKTMDSKDALRLSRSVKSIQTCAGNVQDADCYRDGDLPRLIRKADQLAARLPLQTQQLLVPYENTLGGFQMFSTGVTDLAPELLGWYGAPYIDPSGDTTLFLVGNHLSVKQTRVVAGGVFVNPDNQQQQQQQPASQELLGRQVVRVTIPKGAQTIDDGAGRKVVDVHIATPYGVTSHLLIPAIGAPPPPAKATSGYSWKAPTSLVAYVSYNEKGQVATFEFEPAGLNPPKIVDANTTQPNVFSLGKSQLVLRLTATGTSGTATSLGDTDPIGELTFTKREAEVKLDDFTARIKKQLTDKVGLSQGLTELSVAGYLSVGDPSTTGTTRVLDNAITIKVLPKPKP
jgi:hypothetical protein